MLVKYMKREYALGMVYDGVFRIGTLGEFRDEEKHGREIGDGEEGTDIYVSGSEWRPDETPESLKCLKGVIDGLDSTKGWVFNNCVFRRSHDAYIYCLTEDVGPDYELVNKLGKDRDTCVVVDAPEAFFAELTSGLREVVEIVGGPFVAPCRYADRIQHVAGGDPLGAGIFVKEPRYAYQREVRACWNGKRPIEPVILERCGAGRYCSIACTWKHVEDSGVMSGLKVV